MCVLIGKNVLKLSVYFDHSFIMKPQRQLVVDGVILKHNEQERVLLVSTWCM